MKKFITKTIGFLAIFVACAFALLLFVGSTHKFVPHTKYYSQEFETAFKEKNLELLAFGNSKLLASIDKEILKDQLNLEPVILGCIFTNISVTRLLFESYMNDCQAKPKAVLMEVSWFTFNPVRTQFNDIGGTLILNDYSLWPEAIHYYPQNMEPIKRSIIKQLYQKIKPIGAKDYSSEFKDMSPLEKTFEFDMEEFEKVFPDHIADVDDQLLADYNKIVKMCQDNNIELILYTAPEDGEYTANQIDRERIKDIFKNTPNAIYLDYTEGGEFYKKEYELWMKDSHHINENSMFTKILTKDIQTKRANK